MPLPIPSLLLEQLDIGLNRAVGYVLRGLKHLALWLTGLTALIASTCIMFEYGEGLADISQFEWAFMMLVALLAWRHCHYARQFGYGFWLGLARVLTAQGMALITQFTLLGVMALLMLWVMSLPTEWLATADAMNDDDMAFKTYEIMGQAMVLLALYLGAPTRPLAALTRSAPAISTKPWKSIRRCARAHPSLPSVASACAAATAWCVSNWVARGVCFIASAPTATCRTAWSAASVSNVN